MRRYNDGGGGRGVYPGMIVYHYSHNYGVLGVFGTISEYQFPMNNLKMGLRHWHCQVFINIYIATGNIYFKLQGFCVNGRLDPSDRNGKPLTLCEHSGREAHFLPAFCTYHLSSTHTPQRRTKMSVIRPFRATDMFKFNNVYVPHPPTRPVDH